jgi:hypothetical protein
MGFGICLELFDPLRGIDGAYLLLSEISLTQLEREVKIF